MKKNKCKICGKYKMLEKEDTMKILRVSDEIELSIFRLWKWCRMNNNWCRNIAGKCGEAISEKEKPDIEFEEKQGFDFKMTMEDEI